MFATKRMASLVPLPPSNLTSEGNDLRVAVELFPELLMPPALHPFFGFECRQGCPPLHFPEVSTWSMHADQPINPP